MEIVTATDCNFYVKELLPQALCRRIIEHYECDPRKHPGYTLGSRGEKKSDDATKVSTELEIPGGGTWAAVHGQLHLTVRQAVISIASRFPSLQVWPLRCTGYKIQHYRRREGHFQWHFDALGPGAWERQLAMVLYLNSIERGGETSFHRQNLRIRAVGGDAVFFPTFWTHMPCGETPESADKYIVSSFVTFEIPAAQQPPG